MKRHLILLLAIALLVVMIPGVALGASDSGSIACGNDWPVIRAESKGTTYVYARHIDSPWSYNLEDTFYHATSYYEVSYESVTNWNDIDWLVTSGIAVKASGTYAYCV